MRRIALALAVVALSACSPRGVPGVDRAALDEAVSRAIGDPNSCLLIAERGSGKVLYRYNTATACAREFPSCEGAAKTKLGKVLEATAKDGRPRMLSCYTLPDRSRSVGWASGPIVGRPFVYAGLMEGDRAFPGRMMADRLEGAFRRAKLSTPPS